MSFPPRMASYPAFPVRVTNEEYSPPTPNRLGTPFLRPDPDPDLDLFPPRLSRPLPFCTRLEWSGRSHRPLKTRGTRLAPFVAYSLATIPSHRPRIDVTDKSPE